MASTSAACSNTVVDLSEDNDNSTTQAAASTVPSLKPTESFERSCDNPECSAPKLISLVPKKNTSEFITEPEVVAEPTLINGFTTVFQIDGVGHRIEDIMNESIAAESNTPGGSHKPKTVFRVVPNTHAHIVNYVVVDAASETMKKIKDNDPETMNKLLVSQRLSAEQMLKKLIGKALETPKRIDNPCNPPVNATVPVTPAPIGVSAAKIPPGITIKLLPTTSSASRAEHPVKAALPTKGPLPTKPALPTKAALSTKTALPTKAAIPTKFTLPQANKTVNKSFAPPIIQKTNSNALQPTTDVKTAVRPTAASSGRVLSATKPVVWQAVLPGTSPALKNTSTISPKITPTISPKITPTISPKIAPTISPKITPIISPKKSQPVFITPTNISSSNLDISAPPPAISLNKTEVLDVEKSLPATSIAVSPSLINSDSKQNILKRKRDLLPIANSEPENRKRLRPRSPNRTPLAGNLSKAKESPSPLLINKKLPVLSKNQKPPIPQKKAFLISPKVPNDAITPTEEDQVPTGTDVDTNKNENPPVKVEMSLEPSTPAKLNTPGRRKSKPLMGPASKMKALKAIADAKPKILQIDGTSQCKPLLISGAACPVKIGETIITRTGGSLKAAKEIPEPVGILTKPCSVAITDIAKNNTNTDSDSDSKTKRSLRPRIRSCSEKEDVKPVRKSFSRTTRSSATPKPEASLDDLSDSTLLTTPSAPSRVLRVVLPSTKNGIVNNPATSPHPNLKISSVISGGTTLPASMREEVGAETTPIIINDDNSEAGIEQLQKELADLRRTVARLTQGKKV